MASFGLLRRVALLRAEVSEEISVTLMKEAQSSSEKSAPTRATRRNNPENAILHINLTFESYLEKAM
jgi:hypothetical protein